MYWESRKHLNYYKTVIDWLEGSGHHNSIMDVGGWDTPIITYGSFDRRIAVDLNPQPEIGGVERIVGDFLHVDVPHVSVVTCLQVMEHVPDPVAFAQKLLTTADTVLVSVPYKWPKDACKHHIHDPIDIPKFFGWFGGIDPIRFTIVKDGSVFRMVAQWEGR